ncbi:hypothetical protein HF845_18255, partial [Cellulosimicrobium aquatile]|nr:hypothetical protein [Cellulosimicrobium aquatile]
MTDPQTGPEQPGPRDAAPNPFAPPSAYRSVPVPPSAEAPRLTEGAASGHAAPAYGPGPVPPPPAVPAPAEPSTAAPTDPWERLSAFGQPEAPTRPGGSVDPTLVGVPRGPAGTAPRRGLRPA